MLGYRNSWYKYLFIFSLPLFFLSLSGCLGTLPSKDALKDIQNHTASEVYSSDSVLIGRYFVQNRTNVKFEEISPLIINALVATEDVRFYTHEGVDTRSLLRVLIKTILMGDESSGGGSTISQQLAKNLFPRQKGFMAVMKNKLREAVIAQRLEEVYSKNELLTLYLNTVSFGEEVFGIETAAERYFSEKPKDVNIQQAATLVGMLKATSFYNPNKNPDNAIQRRNVVIGQMTKYGYLDAAVADSIKMLPLDLNYKKITHETGLAPYFREMLRLHLDNAIDAYNTEHETEYNLYTDGFKIYTTIDSRMQHYAEKAVRRHMSELQAVFDQHWKSKRPWDEEPKLLEQAIKNSKRYKILQADGLSDIEIEKTMNTPVEMKMFSWKGGEDTMVISPVDSIKCGLMTLHCGMLAMDPYTGEIKAWVGGIDYAHFKFDHVKAQRQVGSTFKPILYATALESGIHPCDRFSNEQKVYEEYEDWSPENADGVYGGYYSMQGALTHSVNTVSAELVMQTGIKPVIELANHMGIASAIPEEPSIALGSAEIPLLQMTAAYCAFDNGGNKIIPSFLTSVEDKNGQIIIERKKISSERVLSESTAQTITHFLQSVVDSGTATSLRTQYGFSNDIAGKTGTTQNNSDGWFIGYTPALVCGVWTGADMPSVHFRTTSLGQGAKTALPIWALFMKQLQSDPELSIVTKKQFPEMDQRLLASLDCEMYREYDSLWERLFAKKDKKQNEPAHAGREEKSFKDKLKRFFKGKKNR